MWIIAAAVGLSCLSTPSTAGELTHHALEVRLFPSEHRLEAVDTVTLPDSGSAGKERAVTFLLHEGLAPRSTTAGVSLSVLTDPDLPPGMTRYRALIPPGTGPFTVEYGGPIDHPLAQVGEEYARGQQHTSGRIAPEGAYLSESSGWYPLFGEELLGFTLEVELPALWDAVSQGRRILHRRGEGGTRVVWESPEPQDVIYLVAGPYVEYLRPAGGAEAMVFLREADEALASRYLDATAQYLAMYADLIGPYPYGKFALVENFWETGYGMPSFTLLGPKVIRFPFILHSSYPHEILHNWWGNSVYVDYESGNWGEGLTAYLSDHLNKEKNGQGGDYRRTALQKYADYVTTGRDLPLSDFRSRHGSVTEAVGYGKSMMLFHMLRRRLGDDLFRLGLQAFYKDFRFRSASFDDLRRAFEKVSGRELEPFFRQWVKRSGAPELLLEKAETLMNIIGEYRLNGTLFQAQPGVEPFRITVPLAVTMEGAEEAFIAEVTMEEHRVPFEFTLPSRPLRVDIDPEFDLFRRLHSREIPPALTGAFGADRPLILLPSAADETALEGYRRLAESLGRSGPGKVETLTDDLVESLPPDRSVWLLGWENRFLPLLQGALADRDAEFLPRSVRLGRTEVPREDHAVIVTARHPSDEALSLLWIGADNLEAIPGLGRKLPHYHKYSYLAFSGAEPENVAKGRWAVTDSPLVKIFPPEPSSAGGLERGTLPEREPLAELTPLFSGDNLTETVEFLSNPALGGRPSGSPEIDEASRYIAEKLSLYGLSPAGDDGSYFQTWTEPESARGGALPLKNVLAVIPGSKGEWAGQSIVVGAHYDHLGTDGESVLSEHRGSLHPGADDNASGVAVLLELARVLGAGWKPERSVIFAAFTGEELGRLGSRHCVSGGAPFGGESCRAMINLDTIGRLEGKKLLVLGGGSAREWVHIFRGAGFLTGIEVEMVTEDLDSSDHVSFHESGIPAVQLFTGPHLDYHRPGDSADKVDIDGLVKIAAFVKEAVEYLAGREEPLTTAGSAPSPRGEGSERRGARKVSLGTVPDFSFHGSGVRLEGTVPGSPAERAGLKEGDVVTSLGGSPVAALRDLSTALKSHSPGDPVKVLFIRDGVEMSVETVLEGR